MSQRMKLVSVPLLIGDGIYPAYIKGIEIKIFDTRNVIIWQGPTRLSRPDGEWIVVLMENREAFKL